MTDDEFDEFYATSSRRLVGALFAMTGDLAESQDAVQEAFVRAWDHRRQLNTVESPEAWVRTVAWRIAVSHWRRARATRRFREVAPGPVDPPGDDVVVLVDALRHLPESQRRAIVLYHLCDMSIDDVARETKTPTGTVKARLSRGRQSLARILIDLSTEACHD
ncbi:MAG: SigE family RNA polymerase sigma factor [Acidothermaceae bacterium]